MNVQFLEALEYISKKHLEILDRATSKADFELRLLQSLNLLTTLNGAMEEEMPDGETINIEPECELLWRLTATQIIQDMAFGDCDFKETRENIRQTINEAITNVRTLSETSLDA